MAYRVLALKWRPQNFDQIIGQQHVVNTLKNALESNRLAHAYLFSGPRGVGKTSCARILAKALNCKNGPTVTPCHECPQCIEISQGRGLDVIEIDGASNRGIDEIRTLRENVKFAPVSGKFKIYIIDEVHMLTSEAFNALLKTLEEPPAYVKFIFATTQSNKVLPTILSRCQRFDFRRIPVLEIIAQLEKILASENIKIDREVLAAIARSSDGALRDAETILDQVISISGGNIVLKDLISLLGMIEQDTLFEVAEKIIHKDPLGVLSLFNRVIDEGKEPEIFWQNLIEHYRNLMVAKISKADTKLIDLPEEIVKRLAEQAASTTLEGIFSSFNILVDAYEMLRRFDSPRIPLEVSLVMLASGGVKEERPAATAVTLPAQKAIPPHKPYAPAYKSVPAAHSPHQASAHSPKPIPAVTPKSVIPPLKPAHAPAAQPPPTRHKPESGSFAAGAPSALAEETEEYSLSEENTPAPELSRVNEEWKELIADLSKVKISAANYLNEGEPQKIEKGVLTVLFPKGLSLHKEALERKENRQAVEDQLSKRFNCPLRVHLVLSHNEKKVDDALKAQPEVQSALEFFGGKVVE